MNSRRNSKNNIKLPKISSSPSKNIDRNKNKSQKTEDTSGSKYSASAFAVYDQEHKLVGCIFKLR